MLFGIRLLLALSRAKGKNDRIYHCPGIFTASNWPTMVKKFPTWEFFLAKYGYSTRRIKQTL